MSDFGYIVLFLASGFPWAYLVYRGIRFGQFRRWANWGWHRRTTYPVEWAFNMVLNSALSLMFVGLIVWVLVGKPQL